MDRQARKLANRHNQGDRQVECFPCWGLVTGLCIFRETESCYRTVCPEEEPRGQHRLCYEEESHGQES